MERRQSTEGKDTEFHSDSKTNNEKGDNVRTSTEKKESLEEKIDTLPSSSTQNENSQRNLHSSIQKLQTECKDNVPGKSNRNNFEEAGFGSKISSMPKLDKVIFDEIIYKSKDNHSRIFLSVISDDESDSDEKVYFAQVSRPVFYDDFSEDRENSIIITDPTDSDLENLTTELENPLEDFIKRVTVKIPSETKNSSSGISSLVIPDESVSENETNLAQTSSLEVPEETDLQIKVGSLKISNPGKLDETASENHINLIPLSSHIIPGETASGISPFTFTCTSFHKNDSRNSGSLSSKETKLLFKLPEKSVKTKKEQRKVFRKQRYQLPPKDNRSKTYDFKAFSQDQTGNKQFEKKLSPFDIYGTMIPKEIVSDTNDSLGQISRPKVHDVSESKQKSSDIFKFGVSDETSLKKKFSSFHKSRYTTPEKTPSENNSGWFNTSRPVTFGDDNSSNSVTRQKTIMCINSILRRDSSQESEWLFSSQDTSVMKNTRKRKRGQRNRHSVSSSETSEFQVKCEDKSTQTRKNLVPDDNASKSASFTPGRNSLGDLDEETLRSIRTLLSDCLSWLSNISDNNLSNKDAANQKKELKNLKKSKSPVESSPRILKNDEKNKDATNQSKPLPESSLRIHQNDERSIDATNQKKELRNLEKSKSPPLKSSPRIHQKNESNPPTIKISTTVKSNQKAEALQSGADSHNIDRSKLKANLPQSHGGSVEHNQNPSNLNRSSSFNRIRSLMERNTRSRPTTSGQHQSIFFELDGKYIEILVSKKPSRTKRTENESSNGNEVNTREVNRSQSSADTSMTENIDNRNRYDFDSLKEGNCESNKNRSQSHSRKANSSDEHGLEILVSKTPLRIKTSENDPSSTNAKNTIEINLSHTSTDTSKAENCDKINRCHLDPIKGSNEKSNRHRPKSPSSKADNSDDHGLEIKTSSLPASNSLNLSETPTENTNLLAASKLMISSESGSEMVLLPLTGTLIYENSSRKPESVSSDGTELLFKLPEKSTRNRRQKKNTLEKQSHQLSVPPKDRQTKAYDFKPFSQTYTESTPFGLKFSSFQTSGSTISGEVDSSIKDGLDQISNSTVPEEATSDIKGSLGQTSSSTVLDKTASENNETLTNKNCSRNTKSQSSEGTELSFKLPEKSTRNRRMGQRNAARKQRYQLCKSPKESQNKVYDFKPFSQTNTESIPFEWRLSSFQTSGSTNPGKITSGIKDSFGLISSSTVQKETTSDIKDNLDQISSSRVFAQISRSTFPEETTSDIKGQTSSSTVPNETVQESNENLTNKSKPQNFDPSLENKFSHLHITSSVNPDEPASDKNSGMPNIFRPAFSDDGSSFNSVVPLNIAAYRAMNRNISQSSSSEIDSNKTNNDSHSDWWTIFSIDTEESCEIRDVVIAMFLQYLVFTATEYVYEFFNFFFFLLIIVIAVAGILGNS